MKLFRLHHVAVIFSDCRNYPMQLNIVMPMCELPNDGEEYVF